MADSDDTTYSIVDQNARVSKRPSRAPADDSDAGAAATRVSNRPKAFENAPPGGGTMPLTLDDDIAPEPRLGEQAVASAQRGRDDEPPEDGAASSVPPSSTSIAPSRHALGVDDIEALITREEFEKVCTLLGPVDRVAQMSPRLALLYIAARAELGEGADLADLPHLAMETSGKLLEMPSSSDSARLIAKRLLGLNTAAVRRRMPTAPVRLGLIALALIIGAVVGWIAGPGGVDFFELLEGIVG